MSLWRKLPNELQWIILGIVADDFDHKTAPRYTNAADATVCSEWQDFFERKIFRRVIIDQKRLSDLHAIFGDENERRQDYVQHLWLQVEPNEYDYYVCHRGQELKTVLKNEDTLFRALWNLLVILSKWKRPNPRRISSFPNIHKGITLELGIYSPSDSKHDFRDYGLEEDYPFLDEEDIKRDFAHYRRRWENQKEITDPAHGLVNGCRETEDIMSVETMQRVMETYLVKSNSETTKIESTYKKVRAHHMELKRMLGGQRHTWGRSPLLSQIAQIYEQGSRHNPLNFEFPKVEIVTGLLIRRQYYRQIDPLLLCTLLMESFRCLEWFRHERWQTQIRMNRSGFADVCLAHITC